VNGGKIVAEGRGGRIGRMPIHPELMNFADIVFADIWAALDRDVNLVTKFSGVEFHDKAVVLSQAPPSTPAPAVAPVPSAAPAAPEASAPPQ
jgi:hypothetical protein